MAYFRYCDNECLKRQTAFFDRSGNNYSQITTLTRDYPAGHVIPLHYHDFDQLVYASRGVMTVRTSDSSWVVPTHRAVWIPAAVPHTIAMSGTVAMHVLPQAPAGEKSASGVLRGERVATAEGTHPAC